MGGGGGRVGGGVGGWVEGWVGCGEGGWVVGRLRGGIFWRSGKSRCIFFLALAGREFLPKSCLLVKYSPLCNLQTETFLQNPNHTFLPCVPKLISDIFVRVWHAQERLFVIGWGLLRPQDEWRLSWVISVTELAFN